MLGLATRLLETLGICAIDIQSFPSHPEGPDCLLVILLRHKTELLTCYLLSESSAWPSSLVP